MTSILLVDDDPEIRLVLAAGLRRLGYDVRVAADGLEALAVLGADSPDVLLTDIGMPRMDGWELLQLCRSNWAYASMPVVVMSAAHGLADLAFARGVTGFLTKPFTWQQAHAAIQTALQPPAQK